MLCKNYIKIFEIRITRESRRERSPEGAAFSSFVSEVTLHTRRTYAILIEVNDFVSFN